MSAQETATVSLSKSSSVASAAPGTPFTYFLDYSCSSLVTTCNGVNITDVLPSTLSLAAADVTLVGDSHTVATAYDPGTGTATFAMVDPMPAGTTGEVAITVKFPPGTTPPGASATNVGTIKGSNAPTFNSNPSTVTATVTPAIATTKTLNSTPFVLDVPTTYTVTHTNTGNVNLTSPTLVDTLPPGAVFVSASGGGVFDDTTKQVTWSLPDPSIPGAKSTQTVTVTYPSSTFPPGIPITNTVAGTGIPLGTTAPISQPATSTASPVAPAPALAASKSPGGPVALGRPFTYTVSVKNTGNVAVNSAKLLDALPAGATFVSATGGGTYDAGAGTVSWTDPSPLAPGGSFSATVTVRYDQPSFAPGQIVTNNLISSGAPASGGSPVTSSTSVTNTLTSPQAGGTLTKSLTTPPSQFALDVPVTYQLTAKNTGDVPLFGFTVTDPLPPGATFVSASNAGTYNASTGMVTWTLPTSLQAGATQALTVTLIYPSSTFAPGQLVTNTGTATANAAGVPITLGPAGTTNALQANRPAATIKKSDTKQKVSIGTSDTYTIAATNSGNVPLSPAFVLTDALPDNLEPDSQPATNVSFVDSRGIAAGRADTLSWHNAATDTFVAVTSTCTGSGTVTCSGSIPTGADQVRITYTGTMPVGFAPTATLILRVPSSAVGRSGNPILAGDPITNCASVSATQLGSPLQSCTAQAIAERVPTMTLTKTRATPSPVPPPSVVRWQLKFGAPASSAAPILNPVLTDCLPAGLDLVRPDAPGDPANGSPPAGFTPAPSITRVPNGCGANTVEVVWSWAGSDPALSIPPGTTGIFTLNTQIQPGTSAKTLTNNSSATADNDPTPVTSSATVTVASGASLESLKLVKGSLDAAYTKYPDVGHTTLGGSADYQLTVTNSGNVPINKVSVIDTLPFVGDTAVLDVNAARDSAWSPIMMGPVTAPAGVTVSYSTSSDPCRPELNYNPPGCASGTFSTTPPTPISSTSSLEFSFPGTLAPGQTLTLAWPMAAPPSAPVGSVAWNSFGFTGFRTDTGGQLTPAEPNKVGIVVNPYPLSLIKQVNGATEETPPGLYVPVGQPVTYTYLVTNPGDLTVGSINLVDDPTQDISCPDTTIAPHTTMTCTAEGAPAAAGQHGDTATVTGQPLIDGSPAGPATSPVSDNANYFGAGPALTVLKDVNGEHQPVPPGLLLPVGAPVTFTYLVTNTGNVTLDPVTVTDDVLGIITCPETVLAPGDSETCAQAGGTATAGQQQNTATATGQGVDNTGASIGDPVTAIDSAHFFGSAPGISVTKEVDGEHEPTAPGLYVPSGAALTFSYLVTNTGNVTLDAVSVTDDVIGAITCPHTTLAPGDSETCTATSTASAGQHTNTATATGQGVDDTGSPLGNPVSATDNANYFGASASLTVVKDINGEHEPTAPGLTVAEGDPLTFTYLVTNTGNVTLDPVTVTDDVLGATTCPQTTLAPGDSETCTATSTASAGQHTNTATATGQGIDDTGTPVGPPGSATDSANYFGLGPAPALSMVEDIDGHHLPSGPGLFVPTGSTLTFTFDITNTGDATLDDVTLTDDLLGAVSCPQSTLPPGESETCTKTATAQAGEHISKATADGDPVSGTGSPLGNPVTATDTADDFGSSPAVAVVKQINGHSEPTSPGLSVGVGSSITFTYLVTNTGNVTLDAVKTVDSVLGTITCPRTSLAAGQSETCSKSSSASAGTHTNTATVTAQPVDDTGAALGTPVKASDPATYTAAASSSGSTTTTSTTIAPVSQTTPPTASAPPETTSTSLAFTGLDGSVFGRLAAALIVVGLVLLQVSRRRRRSGPG